ncbi:hypothetical protein N340_01080, partial [Tauraco erythrolophus]
FLLLAQGHDCTDFEGMCCMDLSDHSQSIHKQLANLQSNMHHITTQDDRFSNWFGS